MSGNPTRATCRCGKGKVSAWDGKCGHCRTPTEQFSPTTKQMKAELLDALRLTANMLESAVTYPEWPGAQEVVEVARLAITKWDW